MKIVINGCYGGFGLSHEAIMRYAELKGLKLYAEVDEKWDGIIHYYTKPSSERTDDATGYWYASCEIERTDPFLVQVVEELKEKSFGDCAELKIVEIPDGVDWHISEYDGIEHVAEKHRTWG